MIGGKMLDRVRVLVVEDDEDNRLLLSSYLEDSGAVVDAVDSVEEALMEVEDFIPDIVVSDLRMPRQDGYELARTLSVKYPFLPTLAVTAQADDSARMRSLSEGFRAFLRKPFDSSSFVSSIATLMTLTT
jgi:CheY-like chemotaxis protein